MHSASWKDTKFSACVLLCLAFSQHAVKEILQLLPLALWYVCPVSKSVSSTADGVERSLNSFQSPSASNGVVRL